MEILRFILLFLTIIISLNAILKNWFDRLTMCGNTEFHWMPTWFIITFIFVGFFMFLFYKRIREYRKVHYMNNVIRQYEWMQLSFKKYDFKINVKDDDYYKYINYKRYLKLKKLKRKI